MAQSFHRRAGGFTLVEAMAVLAVAAILVAITLPSFSGTVVRARAGQAAAAPQASHELARAEAVRLNLPVAMCRSVDASLARGLGDRQHGRSGLAPPGQDGRPAAGGMMARDGCGVLSVAQDGQLGRSGATPLEQCETR